MPRPGGRFRPDTFRGGGEGVGRRNLRSISRSNRANEGIPAEAVLKRRGFGHGQLSRPQRFQHLGGGHNLPGMPLGVVGYVDHRLAQRSQQLLAPDSARRAEIVCG